MVDRIPRPQCDIAAVEAIATPATLSSSRRIRTRFRGQSADCAPVKYKKILFPSTSEVYGMCKDGEFDPEPSDTVYGPINSRWTAACSAADGSRDPWLWHERRPQLHAVPVLQLDRLSRQHQHGQGRQLTRDHAVLGHIVAQPTAGGGGSQARLTYIGDATTLR